MAAGAPAREATKPKAISGLPPNSDLYRDIHMDTAKDLTKRMKDMDIRMETARGFPSVDDVHMETARNAPTSKAPGFKLWERELLQSPEVKRKATVAQLCASRRMLYAYLY